MHTLSLAQRQMLSAPVVGALAGFLVNRAHGGSVGWVLVFEMIGGALACAGVAAVSAQFRALQAEAAHRAALRAQIRARQAEVERAERRALLVESERQRYARDRASLEERQWIELREAALAAELAEARADTRAIAGLVAEMASRWGAQPLSVADEARGRIAALEAAQQDLAARQVELDRRTVRETEEVKTRLLTLAISDSQRQRNIDAPAADQSGRIVQLEARIKHLAREIERLSTRQPAVAEAGEASKVAPGGTQQTARLGFLKAMLEANQTLRRQIQEAA